MQPVDKPVMQDIQSMLFDAAGFLSELEKTLSAGDAATAQLNLATLERLIADLAGQRSGLLALENRARGLHARALAAAP